MAIEINFNLILFKLQFLGLTRHHSGAQQPHVVYGCLIGQPRYSTVPLLQKVL